MAALTDASRAKASGEAGVDRLGLRTGIVVHGTHTCPRRARCKNNCVGRATELHPGVASDLPLILRSAPSFRAGV